MRVYETMDAEVALGTPVAAAVAFSTAVPRVLSVAFATGIVLFIQLSGYTSMSQNMRPYVTNKMIVMPTQISFTTLPPIA